MHPDHGSLAGKAPAEVVDSGQAEPGEVSKVCRIVVWTCPLSPWSQMMISKTRFGQRYFGYWVN